jgi:hypothetical protein
VYVEMPMPSCTGSFGRPPRGLLGPQLVVTQQLHRLVGGGLVVARVVDEPAHVGERELLVLDPVLPPHLHRVHAQLGGELVHDALDGVRRLGPAGARYASVLVVLVNTPVHSNR